MKMQERMQRLKIKKVEITKEVLTQLRVMEPKFEHTSIK